MELFGFAFADAPELVVAHVPFGALERLWFLGRSPCSGRGAVRPRACCADVPGGP